MKKKVIICILIIVLLWIILMCVDYIRFKNNAQKPTICLHTTQKQDNTGNYTISYGIGYSFSTEEIYSKNNGVFLNTDVYSMTYDYFKILYFIPIKD